MKTIRSLPLSIRVLLALLASMIVAGALAGTTLVKREAQPGRVKATEVASVSRARVIVKFKAGAEAVRSHAMSVSADSNTVASVLQQRASALGGRHGRTLVAGRAITDRMQVVTSLGVDSATLAKELAADADVEYAGVDHRRHRASVPSDPLYAPVAGTSPASGQWYLKPPTASVEGSANTDLVSSINAPAAWNLSTGSGIVIADLDTGIRFDHPDLAGQTLAGYDFISKIDTAGDGDGRDSDASDPGDFVTSADVNNPSEPDLSGCDVEDSSWHGTQTAGILVAGANNGVGMAGVAYNARVLPLRVLGKCGGFDSDIEAAMQWAVGIAVPGISAVNTTPAKVLNMSLGGSGACDASSGYPDIISQVTSHGAVIVAAAGNEVGLALDVPSSCPGVIAVVGLRHAGDKVGFSNLGSTATIAAPGGNCINTDVTPSTPCLYPMLSTFNTGASTPVVGSAGATYTDGVVNPAVGTSFSTPLVTGTVALMMSINNTITPSQVISVLKSTARAFPTTGGAGTAMCQAPNGTEQDECYCTTSTCGAGMLDAGAAVAAAQALVPTSGDSLQAVISVSPSIPDPNAAVTLSAASSQASTGHSIVGYQWTLLSGGGIVTAFSSATNQSTATLTPTANGSFSAQLTVTDDLGQTSTATTTVVVDGLSVGVTSSPAAPVVGDTITFTASGLALASGRTLSSYGWALIDGGGIVPALGGDVTSSTVTAVPTGAGTFTVRLTVTDDLGKQATVDSTVTVAAAASTTTTPASSGGGGAMSWAWMAGLALAVVGLAFTRRRRQGV